MTPESLYLGQIVLCVVSFIILYWNISRNKGALWVIPIVCLMHCAWWLLTGDTTLLFFIGILLIGMLYRLLWTRRGKKYRNEARQ